MSRPVFAKINTNALKHNLQRTREIAPNSAIIAMIKANAYGHGLITVAHALDKADAFGVACIEEGVILRESGVTQPIVLMEGLFTEDELKLVLEYQFDLVVQQERQLRILELANLKQPLVIWLKVDTGMHRLGIRPEKVPEFYARLNACQWVKKPLRLMTHFADAEDCQKPTTAQQIALFHETTQALPVVRSLANSAGVLAWPEAHADWVRPGLMLFGVSPFPDKSAKDFDLQPVMTLCSEIIAVHQCKKGDCIGYGGVWCCPEDMLIGIVAIGYGDGYPRNIPNETPVLVNQKPVPQIGHVSMDMLAVDLRSQPNADCGDPVVLWGEGLPLETVAQRANTIPYTLLCGITQRVPYKDIP